MRAAAILAVMACCVTGALAEELGSPPAGAYRLDLTHGRLTAVVDHLGFSNYAVYFRDFEAELAFDPENPAAMSVVATVRTGSVETLFPDPGYDFNAALRAPEFLDAQAHPEARFVSRIVRPTGDRSAEVEGAFTFRGVTRPLTLSVTYNGGYGGHPMDPGGARIGFSASGSLLRSDYGMIFGIPAPGTTMGVGDRVAITIEAEFLNPAAPRP